MQFQAYQNFLPLLFLYYYYLAIFCHPYALSVSTKCPLLYLSILSAIKKQNIVDHCWWSILFFNFLVLWLKLLSQVIIIKRGNKHTVVFIPIQSNICNKPTTVILFIYYRISELYKCVEYDFFHHLRNGLSAGRPGESELHKWRCSITPLSRSLSGLLNYPCCY